MSIPAKPVILTDMGSLGLAWHRFFLGTGFVLACLCAFASTLAAAPDIPLKSYNTLLLSSQFSEYDITPYVRVFEDSSGQMSFRQVVTKFKSGEGDSVRQGESALGAGGKKAYWILFGVYNRNQSKSRWMLDFGGRMSGTMGAPNRLAIFNDQQLDVPLMTDGRLVSAKQHVRGQSRNAVPLAFEPGVNQIVGVYIEPVPGLPLALNMKLEEQAAFASREEQHKLEQTILLMTVLAIGGCLALFFLNYKKEIPALLIVILACQYGIFMITDEMIPQGNNTALVFLDLFYAGASLAALLLTRLVICPDDKTQGGILMTTGLVLALAGAASLTGTGLVWSDFILLRGAPIVVSLLIILVSARAFLGINPPLSLVYMASWGILLAGMFMTQGALLGKPVFSTVGGNFYWVCFALHFSLLSFSSLRNLAVTEEAKNTEEALARKAAEDEREKLKTRELSDQARLLSVLQREKDLMADLRNREAERVQAMKRAKEMADQANKAKSDFLAVISHEIRTPMTGIMGMIRLLLESPLDPKQKEYARTIQYSGDALLALLNDILDLSKAEEGKMTIENIGFDPVKLLESVVLLMTGRAEEKRIVLQADIAQGIPMALKGDPTRLRQILLNLIGNALKFTDKGSVIVSMRPYDTVGKKVRVYFSVTDTGIGISEDAQKKLFTPYTQADASVARQFGGTGLGLAICKRLVDAMGGSIQVTSQSGAGTTFYFILPFEAAQEEEVAATLPADAPSLRIIVVDDNTINQRVIAGLLEKDGHSVMTRGSALSAIEEIETMPFDLVLMDIEMPEVDGLEATRRIRALPDAGKAALPIIALTGNVRDEDIARCKEAGMDDHLSKPINPENLRKTVNRYAVLREKAPRPDDNTSPPPPRESQSDEHRLFSMEVVGGLKASLGYDKLRAMMHDLHEKAEELITDAEKCLAEDDMKGLSGRGHDLKGMTSNFGLLEISNLAGQIERKAKGGWKADQLAEIVSSLRPLHNETRDAVEAWIKRG